MWICEHSKSNCAGELPPSLLLLSHWSMGFCVACGNLAGVTTTVHHIQFFHRYITPRRRWFTGIIILLCNHLAKLYIQSVRFTSNSSYFAFFTFFCIVERKKFSASMFTFERSSIRGEKKNFFSPTFNAKYPFSLPSLRCYLEARFFFLLLVHSCCADPRAEGKTGGEREKKIYESLKLRNYSFV